VFDKTVTAFVKTVAVFVKTATVFAILFPHILMVSEIGGFIVFPVRKNPQNLAITEKMYTFANQT
jgi:hypothetical protein